jgi:two-component system sensor histidine kinase UhpB
MSLRGRVIALVGLVLLASLTIYIVVAWTSARHDLAAEMEAARKSGTQTVRSTFEDLPRSNHLARDLQQLVATFDGNRHLRAAVRDRLGRVRIASTPVMPRQPAPNWFSAALAPVGEPTIMIVPGANGASLSLQPEPASDVAALWVAGSSAVGLFALAAVIALTLIYWVIGQALGPLADLSRGLGAIGAGGTRERVQEEGPPELLGLQRGFNAMAHRLADIDARNRALEAQLLTIQDEERAEIARDLHDEIGPHLFSVTLDAEMISRSLSEGHTRFIPEQVQSIQSAVNYMQREVRDLIARLRPTRTAELGLEAALKDLVTFWQSRQPEVAFAIDVEAADTIVPEPLRDVIYRVVQEAVANALKHAETTSMSIAVVAISIGVAVRVINEGATKPVIPATPGLGLVSMLERVRAGGGVLHIERASGGWTILARFGLVQEEGSRWTS